MYFTTFTLSRCRKKKAFLLEFCSSILMKILASALTYRNNFEMKSLLFAYKQTLESSFQIWAKAAKGVINWELQIAWICCGSEQGVLWGLVGHWGALCGAREFEYLLLCGFWPVLSGIHFWMGGLAVGYASTWCWSFPSASFLLGILSQISFCNSLGDYMPGLL